MIVVKLLIRFAALSLMAFLIGFLFTQGIAALATGNLIVGLMEVVGGMVATAGVVALIDWEG